jgi:hypothetical protein
MLGLCVSAAGVLLGKATLRLGARRFKLQQERDAEARRILRRGAGDSDYGGNEERSLELLNSWLSPQQQADYRETGSFCVTGSKGGRYRIKDGYANNVYTDKHVFCAGPLCDGPLLPKGDILLAQKIMLEHNERAFLKVARKQRYC